ncbi:MULTISPECIES: winged helix-turn-helix domain-containing protein [Herpetosiphon]|uniref:Transcriptional regulator n=1 Tax=Herpetosiphon geysericola TaxID=70996 RepID=A0A0N8GSY9_9CHLR|nr:MULTISPECIES: winged helix-turn-helix domain-containing protein [Herpetosiphon]KPL90626.1 transcriptional regulator [Herpetosiphon geysericola]MBM7842959.1 pSer/pThr/pTyr-binding forkhead associated (FHA) protein [Herpetosiphon giganteus]
MNDQPVPSLTIKNQDVPPRLMPWEQTILTIGRDVANDIVIDHRLASRRHARLERDEAGCYIRDLDSTNGTYLNGVKVNGLAPLRNNDEVWVADTVIIFRDPEATMKGTPPPVVMHRIASQDQAELHVDSAAKEVYVRGKRLDPQLTAKEFQLLELLYNRRGEVVSKEQIASGVWDYEVYDYNAIDALIYRLRQRIEIDPSAPRFVLTVRGFGYKLSLD